MNKRNQDPVLRRAICAKALKAKNRNLKATFVERFWKRIARVAEADCWLWYGSLNSSGYGMLNWDNERWIAHRVAYTLEVGRIPKGMCVLHTCDTPRCCNPSHLWIGTSRDNVNDMDNKGRRNAPKEEQHWKAKLTAPDVVEIRKLASEGNSHARIAVAFGISKRYVPMIISKRRWKSVE